ncbi:MAG: hypothetical protein ACW98X_20440 [Promethearchaeota archaeon]|jgi:hypothetical protein
MKLCSFDIGFRNFCYAIYDINQNDITCIQNISKNKRYTEAGLATPAFEQILLKIYNNSKTICFKNTDLVKNISKPSISDICHNLNDYLDNNIKDFDDCSVIIIEKQMNINKKAGKIAQHLWSYMSFRYGRFKPIIEFGAYYKTQIIGAPKDKTILKSGKIKYKAVSKPVRKKWAVTKTKEILNIQNDSHTLTMLNSSKKQDDISDVILQAIAFTYLCFVDKSI